MARQTVIVLLIATLLNGLGIFSSGKCDTEVAIHGATPAQREMVAWALGRYRAAGLELPPLTIEFGESEASICRGVAGRVHLDREPVLIRLCWNSTFVLLHELAHVWEATNVPQSKYEPFMAMRTDVLSWAGTDVRWAQRGREHAANVVAWGVLEGPFPVSSTYPNDPDSLRVAFRFLTGTDPLHDGGAKIQQPDRLFFSASRTNPRLESGR